MVFYFLLSSGQQEVVEVMWSSTSCSPQDSRKWWVEVMWSSTSCSPQDSRKWWRSCDLLLLLLLLLLALLRLPSGQRPTAHHTAPPPRLDLNTHMLTG